MLTVLLQNGRSEALLPLYVTTVGTDHEQEPRSRPNGASYHHIFYIEDGEGFFEAPDGRHTLSKGTAIFMHKNCPVTYYGTEKSFKSGWITFDGVAAEMLLEYFGAELFSFCQSELIHPLILRACRLVEKNAPPEALSKVAYDAAVTYFTELSKAKSSPAIAKAKLFIAENCSRDISVPDIAEAAGISQSLLYRLFERDEKTTPNEHLKSVRIQKATRLLVEHPKKKISEVASECGFSDTAYFCKVFKAVTASTPNAFRVLYLP